jgi:DNA-binding NarL/FixJ family response regulator
MIDILIASRNENVQKQILDSLSEQLDFIIVSKEKDESGIIIRTERLKPDVLILDFQLSGKTSPELILMIKRRSPSTAIILLFDKSIEDISSVSNLSLSDLSFHNQIDLHGNNTYCYGVSGLLPKDDINKLADAVRIVFLGGYYISKSLNNNTNKIKYSNTHKLQDQTHTNFTLLERNIIMQMTQGYSDAQIAKNLNYRKGTIKNSLTRIKQKTNLKNRIQIVIYSLVTGLTNLNNLSFDIPGNEINTNDNLEITPP